MRHQINIEQVYLDNIICGRKTHEYRLATPKRRQITFDDEITFISNQNYKSKLTVWVKGVTVFKNWEDALTNRWKQDFKGIYKTFEETLQACKKFYREEDVKEYGIIVYEIELK